MSKPSRTLIVTLGAAGLAACAGSQSKVSVAPPQQVAVPAAPAIVAPPPPPTATDNPGGVVVLATVAGRSVAFIADEDAQAVITFDVDAKKELASTPVGGAPSQLYFTRDARLIVLLRDRNKVLEMRVEAHDRPLASVREAVTPAEPIALAMTPDERTVLVTAGWGRRLAAFDSATLAPRFEVKLPREPRGIVVSDDGRTAFVSHAVGSIVSRVDLTSPKRPATAIAMRGKNTFAAARLEQMKRSQQLGNSKMNVAFGTSVEALEKRVAQGLESCQGFALAKSAVIPNRIFAPQVMVDRGDSEVRSVGYGDSSTNAESAAVSVLDEAAAAPLEVSMAPPRRLGVPRSDPDGTSLAADCLLPRAAAIDPKTKSLLVTCLGIDAVIAYDATAASPAFAHRRHWNVGPGPTGIAVDAERRKAVVFSQFDRSVSVLSLDDGNLIDDRSARAPVDKTELTSAAPGWSLSRALGRILFHASGDARISFDGRACASCHPDGRDDAITWATPEGPRRSIMLAGRVGTTAPYSWDGNAATIDAHLASTFQRLRGTGLRGFEREALVGYVASLPAPPTTAPGDKAKVDRGRELFGSMKTGCATCHVGTGLTDGVTHDVGSKHTADRAGVFNTPSLRFVGGTGPYFHDGRYATLGELLRKSDGKMGNTKHLTNADIDALQSYLETL